MRLIDKINELEKELIDLRHRIPAKKRRTAKEASLNLIGVRYHEVIIILKRIDYNLKKTKIIWDLMRKREFSNDSETLKLGTEYFSLQSEMSLDIQSLYIWVHMIKDIFVKCKISIDLDELIRISYLRNKFITHAPESPLFKKSRSIRSGMMFNENDDMAIILFTDTMDNKRFSGVKKLVTQAKSHIPELKNEPNMYNQMKIIYKNLNKLKGTILEHKAHKLIKRIGVATESPVSIADELLKSLKAYRKLI